MKRILVATDGSEPATRAVEFACALAKAFDAPLLIVTVALDVRAARADLSRFAQTEELSFVEALTALSQTILQKATSIATALGVRQQSAESRIGDAAEEILDLARNRGVDTLVVGKRGSGRLAGLLLGSVSQKLVSLATVPVIVVP